MLISLFCMIINFAINTATHKEYGYICVAYASTISAIFGGFLSLYFAIKSKLITISRPLMKKSILIILANIILFCFQFQASRMLKIYVQSPTLILMIISFTSISIYLFLIKIMRVYSMSEIKSVLKKS
jgi:peptidoglycan biosynthesis protein MviN/MurJ (putative lipid II flippase)